MENVVVPFMQFDGPVWRLLPKILLDTPAIPAQAPEGRFHHSGQVAAYASLTVEGAGVAVQRYLSDGAPRFLVPMWLNAEYVVDERGNQEAPIVWQDLRATLRVSPTWKYSDVARKAGAQAMLYSSRSRPELSHVVVFEPSCLPYIGPATMHKTDNQV